MHELWMSIDPGTTITGTALWSKNILKSYSFLEIKKGEWFERIYEIGQAIKILKVEFLVIELPEVWNNNKSANSYDSQSLIKLSISVGYYAGIMGCKFIFIPAKQWKGQLPKLVTKNRMIKKYNLPNNLPFDVYDAIGLGDYYVDKH